MPSEFPLNIEPKQDSPSRLEQLASVDPALYTTAIEFNKILLALAELDSRYLPELSVLIADMAQTDTTAPSHVKNRIINVLTSRNFQETDDDAILLIGADVTLTLTNSLQTYFSCNILVRGSYTCTIADGGEALYAPNGLELVEDDLGIILTTNTEFILKI